ncbi:alanine--tRNA ligase [Geodermatophilus obscurus]|uniref:Alanine--tRNA ligase n=1 Tax=Geodermatophilus obscurus (strain ATCC 25078 / DSM 43160 / JCM 3152 / CCUG 61914 / KCC A-0152 / KCTC 9177 / NBRC 13315 / NRRL B-3577 / G-20) TaxID=526225 RepID=D2S9G4_GEOOG|nr:alanine--tRNA ligase [Geodermatophilus obscurus]ADB75764.1 alanyl-tRNA synthetase [Geodermatophilus obscurus DSM 43160]
MQTAEIRRRFLEHFASRGHTVVPSASLVSPDPSLLFTVAGMVPFIPYLTGREPAPYPRATSVQKCVRTLDIEEVGKTTRHGTFFQMNGNFSFGDYFKEGAIQHAWELVTGSVDDGGLGFDPERIWVTVYLDDDEAAEAWHRIAGLPVERIQRLGKKDNYWHTGQPGPGGPCSEIYYDRGPQFGPDGGPLVDTAGDRFLEIWNLVFMQYELTDVRSKEDFRIVGELPKKNIDTGMGLERVAYLLQGVDNLYEIDEVAPVLHRAAEIAGVTYGAKHDDDVRLRVVADHVRSGLMLIGDGVTPGNEGRGYILRRLLRRAVRSMKLLGVDEATLPALLPVSRDAMKASYPELETDFARISSVAYAEEEAFRRTLSSGTALFDTAVREARAAGTASLSGDQAFSLHDTYGFPIDVTLEMAAEQGVTVDEEGFRALMQQQRDRARADARAKRTGSVDVLAYRRLLADHGPTDWRAYDTLRTDSRVLGLVSELAAEEGPTSTPAGPGEITRVVLDRTPFYAESGGQVADAGVLTWDGGRAEVLDVQRPVKGLVAHQVRVLEGELREGAELTAEVDREWRLSACQAHSGTHVVHAALRQVLGPQALQSGSYNRPGYLRLDFAWQGALSAQQRHDIEDVANAAVRADHRVSATYMTLPEAQAFGALALFGETYGEQVRVVEIGGPWSRELCGGTHVQGSAQIGTLALTGESSVGSGSRRVEAVVGLEGFRYLARERDLVRQLGELLKTPTDDLVERVSGMLARLRDVDKELAELRAQQTLAAAGELAAGARDVGGVAVVTGAPTGLAGGDLRTLALDVRGRLSADRPAVVLLASESGGKVALVTALNPAAQARGLTASDVLRAAAAPVGGRGGGKPDVAQGGGTDPAGIPAALQAGEQAVATAAGR